MHGGAELAESNMVAKIENACIKMEKAWKAWHVEKNGRREMGANKKGTIWDDGSGGGL